MPDTPATPGPTPRKGIPPAIGIVLVAVLLGATVAIVIYRQFPELVGANSATTPVHGQSLRDSDRRMQNSPQIERIDDEFDLSGLTLDRDQIISPNPDKDDIPSLTTQAARGDGYIPPEHPHWAQVETPQRPTGTANHAPEIVALADNTQVSADTKIIGVTINGESRAYPHAVLDRHECVNDVLGGVPIAVTYCPLCDSATVFDRRMGSGDDEVTLEFGVSGLLYNSNVLLYDRTHDALWSQVLLTAVSGPFAGEPLRYLAGWEITTLGQWQHDHPDATVLTYNTGLWRYRPESYHGRAYADYFAPGNDALKFPVNAEDDRLPKKTPVIGVVFGDTVRCYRVDAIDGTWFDTLDGDGAMLELRGDGAGGVAIVGMPDGAQVTHTFWYAWFAFHPETELIESRPGE